MAEVRALDELVSQLEDLGPEGGQAAANVERWLAGAVPLVDEDALRRHLTGADLDLITDEFWRIIPFGTGGRRGPVGFGPNRINAATVGASIQGHCNYLLARGAPPSAVVANDVRVFLDLRRRYRHMGRHDTLAQVTSRGMARLAARVYAANGFVVSMEQPLDLDGMMTTPQLSFAIRELGCGGGINMSASHNHPDDNGVKVYDAAGGQEVPPEDARLAEAIEAVEKVALVDFAAACQDGSILPIPDGLWDDYTRVHLDRASWKDGEFGGTVVFTPLSGCGVESLGRVLDAAGVDYVVPPGEGPDGSFARIPLRAPNPEVAQATEPARAHADSIGADLVLSTDPDADRIGLEVRRDDGVWQHLTGNDIAILVVDWLVADPMGPRERGLVLETSVTSALVGDIVRRQAGGDSRVIDDFLVGFKYLSRALDADEEQMRTKLPLVLAAEESHGLLTSESLRDKDAASAALFLLRTAQRAAAEGETLAERVAGIRSRYGGYAESARSMVFEGLAGTRSIASIMSQIRTSPPASFGAAEPVAEAVDYLSDDHPLGPIDSATDRAARDLIRYEGEGFRVVIRPSGTEPKLKIYVLITAHGTLEGAGERSRAIGTHIYSELAGRVGFEVSDDALALSDLVSIEAKKDFDGRVVDALRPAAGSGRIDGAAQAALDEACHNLLPGADARPALVDWLRGRGRAWATDQQALGAWETAVDEWARGEA